MHKGSVHIGTFSILFFTKHQKSFLLYPYKCCILLTNSFKLIRCSEFLQTKLFNFLLFINLSTNTFLILSIFTAFRLPFLLFKLSSSILKYSKYFVLLNASIKASRYFSYTSENKCSGLKV